MRKLVPAGFTAFPVIPYFELHVLRLGPIPVQVWGLMVALGIVIAALVGRKVCRRRGLDPEVFTDFAVWILAAAFVGSRLLYALAYAPHRFVSDPLAVLRVWEGGFSSFGGFIGAAVGAAIVVRKMTIDFGAYADVAAYVLPLGYGCGRIGCFLIHDHPGTLSSSFLAVRFPEGSRLDHGLLLSIFGISLFVVFALVDHRQRTHLSISPSLNRSVSPELRYSFLPLFMLLYGAVRFLLDFFRANDLPASDARYLGLTPAQYGSAIFVIAAAAFFAWRRSGTMKSYVQT